MGKKRHPIYRIVIVDSHKPRDGAYKEAVGFYDPNTEPATIRFDEEKVFKWLEVGVIPTDTVKNLLRQEGLLKKWHEIKIERAKEEKAPEPQEA